jgi:hypothetical protein
VTEQPQKLWPSVELDRWCWQLQVLDDLAKFVESHGPFSTLPLPTVHWTLGVGTHASADLTGSEPNSTATLAAFARALGSDVHERRFTTSVMYYVRGQIGAREGSDRQPRTSILLRMTVFLEGAEEAS